MRSDLPDEIFCHMDVKKKSHIPLINWVQALIDFLQILESNARKMTDRFSENVMTLGGSGSSWSGYRELRGTYFGIINLEKDLDAATRSYKSEHHHKKRSAQWLIHWLRDYRFNELLREEYGGCCIERLKAIKEKLARAIEEGNPQMLNETSARFWL